MTSVYSLGQVGDGVESVIIDTRPICPVLSDGSLKWVPLKALCLELGISHDAQRRRIVKSQWARHCSLRVVAADGKGYSTFCISLNCLDMWLSTLVRGRLKGSPTTAYFIRSRLTGYIKIGTSVNARARLRGIASSYPDCFELLAVGGIEVELHERLSKHRVHGEWFRPHAEVLKALQKVGGNPDQPIVVAGLKKKSEGPDDFSWLEGMKFEVDD